MWIETRLKIRLKTRLKTRLNAVCSHLLRPQLAVIQMDEGWEQMEQMFRNFFS